VDIKQRADVGLCLGVAGVGLQQHGHIVVAEWHAGAVTNQAQHIAQGQRGASARVLVALGQHAVGRLAPQGAAAHAGEGRHGIQTDRVHALGPFIAGPILGGR